MIDDLIPEDHVILGGDHSGERDEIDVTPTGDGATVSGLTPPYYDPHVSPQNEHSEIYRVERAGESAERVNFADRDCTCKDRQRLDKWCIHLRAVAVYRRWQREDE